MTVSTTKFRAGLCIASAFFPILIAAWNIHRDVAYSDWQILSNSVNLTAFLWLGLTVFHYRRTRTKNAAWLFALFPIAFAEPILLLCLWLSVAHPFARAKIKTPEKPNDAMTLIVNYYQRGRYDDAIRAAQDWMQRHPEDSLYDQIALCYLAKAAKDSGRKEQWIQEAVSNYDKDLEAHKMNTVDVELYEVGRGFESAGDLSTHDSCLYYGRAVNAFVQEVQFIQGDSYTAYGHTTPLAPVQRENQKALERVKSKIAKAGCKGAS